MREATTVKIDMADETLHLNLEGFSGPLALLLELARAQKVDLVSISIAQLAEQYVHVVEKAHNLKLNLAADWLVMAAWLAWLKSRLLLPHPHEEEDEEVMDAVEQLQGRLFELERMRRLAVWLEERAILGRDVFARAEAEEHRQIDNTMLKADITALISAYLAARRRGGKKRVYRPAIVQYWRASEACSAMRRFLRVQRVAGWMRLEMIIPPRFLTWHGGKGGQDREGLVAYRAAFAGALLAGLEMAKSGTLELRQEERFGEIEWRGVNG